MNAYRSPKEAAACIVEMFMPGASEEEKALRARLHLAIATAHSRFESSQSDLGGRAYISAATIARAWVFKRDVSKDDLEEVIKILSWIFLAAGALERLEAPDD